MQALLTNLYLQARAILEREEGQDLVEYSLLAVLISLGSVTGMSSLATGLNGAFSGIATTLSASV